MKILDKIFGLTKKKKQLERLNKELQISIERIEKNEMQQEVLKQASLDGENGWFRRVCVDPEIIKQSGDITNGTITTLTSLNSPS